MSDLLSQSVPDSTWIAVAGIRGVWVYQRTGKVQELVLELDGTITSPAGPIWDIRIDPTCSGHRPPS